MTPLFVPSRTWPSSLTGRAIARKARGPGFDSRLGCGGHFFLSPVVALFILSLSKYLFSTHPECSLKIFSIRPRPSLVWRDSIGLGAQGHQWILLKTWVIGIVSAGEGESDSVICSESDLAQ